MVVATLRGRSGALLRQRRLAAGTRPVVRPSGPGDRDRTLARGRVASVQGSRSEPYAVRITVKELDDAAWANVETAMAARALFLARLLAGEMPDEIEEAFDAAKVRLFPARRGDLVTSCTCPDTANPCKHIAAVYYLLAESFDENPFLIFEWRGRPRARLSPSCGRSVPQHRRTAHVDTRHSRLAPPLPGSTAGRSTDFGMAAAGPKCPSRRDRQARPTRSCVRPTRTLWRHSARMRSQTSGGSTYGRQLRRNACSIRQRAESTGDVHPKRTAAILTILIGEAWA